MARKPKLKPISISENSIFSPGTAVEISSDEPGFRGSFYLGSIVRARSSDSYLVEYKTLVKESPKGPRPLKEVVRLAQLRPALPLETKWVFTVGDEVDVYHNDGWWEAVVTSELGNGRFQVFFGAYKEEMEFAKEDMRLHRKWVNGIWVPQLDKDKEDEQKTQIGKEKSSGEETKEEKFGFEKGTVVEVSSDEDGFHGAWFTATIVEPVGKDKFIVEYKNLRTDDDKEFLKEEIDKLHIRPCPPENLTDGCFQLLEEVDAFYNDGWWVGVISKLDTDLRYVVYFKSTKEEMQFHHSELRLHQEWIGGKWVVTSQALKF
ncbi:protein AGENET DOMAIN (AGD)-CONTAINING P1 isoform X2 [Humulus lupulus]|uniref:protein AGENET DOMAIN (AGD)-CONTAINING P1 isoform X2 n=1 Tax=Humulus lupulus TaxID=3486 RepID=UPI002B417B71|nr:protein AGENET DOMAIN (AGD)-CONTAINING P1 isoform X2 [Humulus lupulus]